MKTILINISASALSFILRIFRPMIFIRFGSLNANKIGPLISLPGLYILEKEHGVQPANTLDIFHDGQEASDHICNHQLLCMWKRVFKKRKGVILSNRLGKYFYKIALKTPAAKEHVITTKKHGRDVLGLIEKVKPLLSFTEDEIKTAREGMEKMGLREGDRYVCMINRDQSYLKSAFPDMNWEYHSFRNCRISNYMSAAEELTKRGYTVIRMGSKVGDLMETDNPKIIDYAHHGHRTELLDLYLAAHCSFFIGCNSGFDAIPWFFHRPEVYVNISDLEYAHSWISDSVMVFKKYWIEKEKRFMSVAEMIESGAGRYQYSEQYEKHGIELIENTPEEILDAADEMDQRLRGEWCSSEEDELLQKRFWSYFNSDLHGVLRARIGAKFLRDNKEIFGLNHRSKIYDVKVGGVA